MLLELSDIAVRFGPADVLREVTCRVAGGELVALAGGNGAGKTTLLRVAAGLLPASRGTRSIAAGARVGFLPQHPTADPAARVAEVILTGRIRGARTTFLGAFETKSDEHAVERVAAELGLSDLLTRARNTR
jgi:ABC-type Mn2+/Zn2+ transport system ATPase subunit